MKGLISSHKTPKFGDLSPDILKGSSSIHSGYIYFNIFNKFSSKNWKTDINKKKKIPISNSINSQKEYGGIKKSEITKADFKENKLFIIIIFKKKNKERKFLQSLLQKKQIF